LTFSIGIDGHYGFLSAGIAEAGYETQRLGVDDRLAQIAHEENDLMALMPLQQARSC